MQASIIYENKNTGNCIWYYKYKNKVTKQMGMDYNTSMYNIDLPLDYDMEHEKNLNEKNGYELTMNAMVVTSGWGCGITNPNPTIH